MSHARHVTLALATAIGPLLAQTATTALPEDRAPGAEAITTAELREWLTYLASEELTGRATGSEGFAKAADYLRTHFEELGLQPGNGEDFLQTVAWTRRAPIADDTGLQLRRDGETIWSLTVTDGLRGDVTVSGESSGPVAIVVCRTDQADEIAELDLTDHAVIVAPEGGLIGELEPNQEQFAPYFALRAMNRLGSAVRKAGGTLVAVADDRTYGWIDPPSARSSPGRSGDGSAEGARNRRPNRLVMTRAQLDRLAAAAGLDTEVAQSSPLAVAKSLGDVDLGVRTAIRIEDAPAYNVLAVLPGSDPDLANEFVAIGCHLDHLGIRGGAIHPGADDDGSGSVGLMAIASAFAKNTVNPRRSILFMAFCGEENGLIGSAHFARHPTIPLESIVAEIQIDMIGRREELKGESAEENANSLHLIGTERLSQDLHDLCLRINDTRAGFDLEWDEEDVFSRSDHFNFARHGVPIAFLFTGFHPDYHRPTDTVEKIDFAKLARVSTYVYDLAFELAQQDERPLVDADKWRALRRKGRETPAAPVREP